MAFSIRIDRTFRKPDLQEARIASPSLGVRNCAPEEVGGTSTTTKRIAKSARTASQTPVG
jgi:hypothetical protein